VAIYSVTQITDYLKDLLASDQIISELWIRGEVSNLSKSGAGHFYFTLKDSQSQMRCVMFRPAFGSDNLQNGTEISAHGRISLYDVRGDLQFYVDLVQPEGLGSLHLELERLKTALASEGLFLESHKQDIPAFPNRIGVITSPSGSVWHDIQNIIRRRYPLVELCLAPATVQGDKASYDIVSAIAFLNKRSDVDLVIIARGGGSIEELWPFNEESVARAIYASRIPIISAIGHETDYTISDMVADHRAPTPSAAAEIAVPDRSDLQQNIVSKTRRMAYEIEKHTTSYKQELRYIDSRLISNAPEIVVRKQRIDEILNKNLAKLKSQILLTSERIKSIELRLNSLGPNAVLERGYAIVENTSSSKVIQSIAGAKQGDKIGITVSDGTFHARV
jgi:exodeoxyribonuclease VII large subunit